MPGIATEFLLHDRQVVLGRRFSNAPWFQNHSAKAVVRERDLKGEARVRDFVENFSCGVGVTNRVVDGCVSRRSHDAEDDALVLCRAPVPSCDIGVKQERRGAKRRPHNINGRARLQRAIEMASIPIAKTIECAIDETAESVIGVSGPQQMRRHHRRKDKRDDAGNENRAGERKREFAEERAGQSTLQSDRRVNGRERDRHGDDRTDQFARAHQGRVHARHAFAHMSLDVFDHDDGVIDDQSDREHDREQREQVECETKHLHEKQRADQRNRNRHDRHDHRTNGAEEQKDHDHHDEQRVDQSFYDFVDRVVDVGGGVVGDLRRPCRSAILS